MNAMSRPSFHAPRLCFTDDHYAALLRRPKSTFHRQLTEGVRQKADHFVAESEDEMNQTGHNWHLVRGFRMQVRLFTLLVEYKRSREQKYFDALWQGVQRMYHWEYWSWIAWRKNDPAPDAVYDLSYGVNSLTLAFVYDALRDDWNDAQRQVFIDIANHRSFPAYLKHTAEPTLTHWYINPHSNWNTVCNGGAGVLALALREHCPDSKEVLRRVEKGIKPFFQSTAPDGGWPEGVGYWNFGMRYGFLYLLSHETATGKTHLLLKNPAVAATLKFPLLFTPNGIPCGFGDSNGFAPQPFHLLAARRLQMPAVQKELLDRFQGASSKITFKSTFTKTTDHPELLLLVSHDNAIPKPTQKWQSHRLIKGLDWGYAADAMPRPRLYFSVRGGTIDMPHTHRDLLSFFCVINGERLIDNVPVDNYLDTTFSSRRQDLYEVSPQSKNTMFINGVGITDRSAALIKSIESRNYNGFRLDATSAMGTMRDGNAAIFCGRLILLLKNRAIAVIDECELPFAGLVESRLHTFSKVKMRGNYAEINGIENRLHLSFASSVPAQLQRGQGIPTHPPRQADTMLRHRSQANITRSMLCALLVPNGRGIVNLQENGMRRQLTFEWEDNKGAAKLHLDITPHLTLSK